MIEVIYKDESAKNSDNMTIKLPKNIRQIGDGSADYQIYIEDNVMNYIKKIPKNTNDIRYGVLLGNIKKGYGYTYIFINGAVDARDVVENTVIFSDEIWTSINDDMHRYFSKLSVVGWFTSIAYQDNDDMTSLSRIHLDNFACQDMVYLKLDRNEDEESFYIYSGSLLKRLPGYHIYYERNSDMDDYIYGKNEDSFVSDRSTVKQIESKGEITGKYGIEENKRDDNKTNTKKDKSRFIAKVKKNVASVAMVAMLGGTLALVTNENAMRVIKDKITNMSDGTSLDDSSDIKNILAVNGMINGATDDASKNSSDDSLNEKEFSSKTEMKSKKQEKTDETKEEIKKEKKTSKNKNTPNKNSEDDKNITEDKNSIDKNSIDDNSNKADNSNEDIETGTVTTIDNIDLQQETYNSQEQVTASVSVDETKTYIVAAGDTIYSIAIMNYGDYNKVDEIMMINSIDNPDTLEVGDKIILP